jgi:hypothetical protein
VQSGGAKPDIVIRSNSSRPNGFTADTHPNAVLRSIDIYRALRGPGDCDVPSTAEDGLDLDHGATNVHSVEQFPRPWHGDGGKHTHYAERYGELEDRERVAQCRCPSI